MKRSGFKPRVPAREERDQDRVRHVPMPSSMFMNPRNVGPVQPPMPKSVPQRKPKLLAMARYQSCVLRIEDVCNGDRKTVVACHSNLAEHGKAGARKADDCYVVWGCSACHSWLDQGSAPKQDKRAAFMAGLRRMKEIYYDIDAGMQPSTPQERDAARWAIERMKRLD